MSVSGLTSKPPPEPAAAQDAAVELPAHQSALAQFCHRYALLFAWAATIVLFGLLEPESFLQIQNFTSIFNSQAVLVVLTCSLVLTLTSSEYDLSAASVLSLSAMLIAVLNAQLEVPVGWAILVAIAAGVLVGTINGILVVVVGVESIIATLGMGSLVSGMTLWISHSNMISGISSTLVNYVIVPRFFGISLGFVYAVLIAAALWYFLTYTPLGRQLLFVGRGRRVARLSGLAVGRLRFGAMVGGSFLAVNLRRALRGYQRLSRSEFRRQLHAPRIRCRVPGLHVDSSGPLQCLGLVRRCLLPGDGNLRSVADGHPGFRSEPVLWRRTDYCRGLVDPRPPLRDPRAGHRQGRELTVVAAEARVATFRRKTPMITPPGDEPDQSW